MFITKNGEANIIECEGKPFIRKPWCRQRFVTVNDEPSMTQGVHAELHDVDSIVARFRRTGQLPVNQRQPQYGDVTGLQVDLTEALNNAQNTLETATAFADTWEQEQKIKEQEAQKQKESTEKQPDNPV